MTTLTAQPALNGGFKVSLDIGKYDYVTFEVWPRGEFGGWAASWYRLGTEGPTTGHHAAGRHADVAMDAAFEVWRKDPAELERLTGHTYPEVIEALIRPIRFTDK